MLQRARIEVVSGPGRHGVPLPNLLRFLRLRFSPGVDVPVENGTDVWSCRSCSSRDRLAPNGT